MSETQQLPACGQCRGPLPPRAPGRAGGGHPRWYCSHACRQAAYRERRAQVSASFPELTPRQPATEEQMALAVLESRSAAAAFVRLGRQVRRDLAWRCTAAGEEITDTLEEYFDGV